MNEIIIYGLFVFAGCVFVVWQLVGYRKGRKRDEEIRRTWNRMENKMNQLRKKRKIK